MRITAELIEKSSSFINAVKDRELDLRNNKILSIENLSITKDQYDTLDLTDNDLRKLDNFPTLRRLRTLLLSNNQISSMDTTLEWDERLPNLEMLVLNNNPIDDLKVLGVFKGMKNLKYLSLIDCPISRQPNYRTSVISLLPNLKVLDFNKITLSEREAAKSGETIPERPKKRVKVQKGKIEEVLKNVKNLEELKQMEKILATGHIPDS